MRDRDVIIVALAVVLAGCPLGATTTTTLTAGRSATTTAPVATASPPAAAANAGADDGTPVIAGAIVRRQLEALHGLTPDQARQQLKKLGHDGNVTIGEVTDSGGGHTYLKECGQNKVCSTSGESGIGLHDDLILFINPTLKIAPPP